MAVPALRGLKVEKGNTFLIARHSKTRKGNDPTLP
jgi:hypothetical protein